MIFSKNATESLNLIAYSYGLENLKKDDEVVISIMEHHSNLVTWQKMTKAKNAKLKYMYVNDNYEIPDEEIETNPTCGNTSQRSFDIFIIAQGDAFVNKISPYFVIFCKQSGSSNPCFSNTCRFVRISFVAPSQTIFPFESKIVRSQIRCKYAEHAFHNQRAHRHSCSASASN